MVGYSTLLIKMIYFQQKKSIAQHNRYFTLCFFRSLSRSRNDYFYAFSHNQTSQPFFDFMHHLIGPLLWQLQPIQSVVWWKQISSSVMTFNAAEHTHSHDGYRMGYWYLYHIQDPGIGTWFHNCRLKCLTRLTFTDPKHSAPLEEVNTFFIDWFMDFIS